MLRVALSMALIGVGVGFISILVSTMSEDDWGRARADHVVVASFGLTIAGMVLALLALVWQSV